MRGISAVTHPDLVKEKLDRPWIRSVLSRAILEHDGMRRFQHMSPRALSFRRPSHARHLAFKTKIWLCSSFTILCRELSRATAQMDKWARAASATSPAPPFRDSLVLDVAFIKAVFCPRVCETLARMRMLMGGAQILDRYSVYEPSPP